MSAKSKLRLSLCIAAQVFLLALSACSVPDEEELLPEPSNGADLRR